MPQSRSELSKLQFSRVKHFVPAGDAGAFLSTCGTGVFDYEARLAFQDRVFAVACAMREATGRTNLDAMEEWVAMSSRLP